MSYLTLIRLAVAVVSVALAQGCSPVVTIPQEKADLLKTVSIEPVQINTHYFSNTPEPYRGRMLKHLEDNRLDLARMVHENFSIKLQRSAIFKDKLRNQDGDGRFLITVRWLQLDMAPVPFKSGLSLAVTAVLIDKNENVIWENGGWISAGNLKGKWMTFDDFLEGDNMKEAMMIAVGSVVGDLTAGFALDTE